MLIGMTSVYRNILAQYSTRRIHSHSTRRAFACSTLLASLARSTALILFLARSLTCSQAHGLGKWFMSMNCALACLLACWLAPLTHCIAPHCSPRSCTPLRSLVRSRTSLRSLVPELPSSWDSGIFLSLICLLRAARSTRAHNTVILSLARSLTCSRAHSLEKRFVYELNAPISYNFNSLRTRFSVRSFACTTH